MPFVKWYWSMVFPLLAKCFILHLNICNCTGFTITSTSIILLLRPSVVGKCRFCSTFKSRSRDVIYGVIGMSGMSNDVKEECLECHMTSQKYLLCLVTSEKNVTSQWWRQNFHAQACPEMSKHILSYYMLRFQTSYNCVNK